MPFTGYLGTADSQLGNIFLSGGGTAGSIAVSTGNTLDLSDSASAIVTSPGGVTTATTHNVLHLTEIIIQNGVFVRAVTDNLIFVQFAGANQARIASNTIIFSQTADYTKSKWVNNTLAITQTLNLSWTHNEILAQNVGFNQIINVHTSFNRSILQSLVFTHSANAIRVKVTHASNFFNVRGFTVNEHIVSVTNTLNLTQTVNAHKITNGIASNTINFTQVLDRVVIFNLTASNTLTFLNGFELPIDIGLSGGGDDEIGAESQNGIPTLTVSDTVFIPAARASLVTRSIKLATKNRVITVKRPLYGDTENNLDTIILQRSVNAEIYTYVRKTASRKLSYKFEVARDKMTELQSFITTNLSTVMELTNWKGEVWYGYVTNNPFPAENIGAARPCGQGEQYSVQIEFTGVRVH